MKVTSQAVHKTWREPRTFSPQLQKKVKSISDFFQACQLGSLSFPSRLVQAPMAGICSIPYRLLMEELGAGFTISELISCHGINHGNERTLKMLTIHPRERHVGLQLFGEDPESMAKAAKTMEEYKPKFIDINMGCPVRKVVTKGGGAALLQEPEKLRELFTRLRDVLSIPLTIKIRTGWDADHLNANEVIEIANDCGIEWVSIHGRTRTQQYTGKADWAYMNSLVTSSPLPVIGNGDLHTPQDIQKALNTSPCSAFMIARGSIRNPFIFLEAYTLLHPELSTIKFNGEDYFEIIERLAFYTLEVFDHDRTRLVQLRKFIAWFAAGFPQAAKFRGNIFQTNDLSQALKIAESFFTTLPTTASKELPAESFMTSGHG